MNNAWCPTQFSKKTKNQHCKPAITEKIKIIKKKDEKKNKK